MIRRAFGPLVVPQALRRSTAFRDDLQTKKPGAKPGSQYMDGLVSTGK